MSGFACVWTRWYQRGRHARRWADEPELLEWLCGRHAYLSTPGIGTTQHLQLPLAGAAGRSRAGRQGRAQRAAQRRP